MKWIFWAWIYATDPTQGIWVPFPNVPWHDEAQCIAGIEQLRRNNPPEEKFQCLPEGKEPKKSTN